MSGFGAIAAQRFAGEPVKLGQNLVRIRGEIVSPAGFVERMVAGFRRAAAVLCLLKQQLLAAGGPLPAFRGRPVRVILRHSLSYREALRSPGSLSTEPLLRPVGNPILFQAITRAEHRALQGGDIPRFTAATDSRDWTPDPELTIPEYFAAASHDALMERVQGLEASEFDEPARLLSTALALWGLRDLVSAADPVA